MNPTTISLFTCIAALGLAACQRPTPIASVSDATLKLSRSTWGCTGEDSVLDTFSLELLPNSGDYGTIDATATLDGVVLKQVERGDCPTGFEVGGSIHRCTPPMWILDGAIARQEPGHVGKIVVSDATGSLSMEVRDVFTDRRVQLVQGGIGAGRASLDWTPATDTVTDASASRITYDLMSPGSYVTGSVPAANHAIDFASLPEGAIAGETLEVRWTAQMPIPACGAAACEAQLGTCQLVTLP
ncbi:MAG: hypothetical protein QM765_33885 [Myxococcales bacterium]